MDQTKVLSKTQERSPRIRRTVTMPTTIACPIAFKGKRCYKAYDRADMDDIINEGGFSGKIWKLTKALNENLTARVKTKAGLMQEIRREKGGKQGAKLMVPMFSKMMDTLPKDMHENPDLGIQLGSSKITALAFVDDILSFAIGKD